MLLSKLTAVHMSRICKISQPHCEVILAAVGRLAPPEAIVKKGLGNCIEIRFDPTEDEALPPLIEAVWMQECAHVIINAEPNLGRMVICESARRPEALGMANRRHYRTVPLASLGHEIERVYRLTVQSRRPKG